MLWYACDPFGVHLGFRKSIRLIVRSSSVVVARRCMIVVEKSFLEIHNVNVLPKIKSEHQNRKSKIIIRKSKIEIENREWRSATSIDSHNDSHNDYNNDNDNDNDDDNDNDSPNDSDNGNVNDNDDDDDDRTENK